MEPKLLGSTNVVRRGQISALASSLRRGCSVLALSAPLLFIAAGAAPIVLPAIGDLIYNPTTGLYENVVRIPNGVSVVTTSGYTLFLPTKAGDSFTDPNTSHTIEVQSVVTDAGGHTISVVLLDKDDSKATPVAQTIAVPPGLAGANGIGYDVDPFAPAAGNINVIRNIQTGKKGSNGHDGGGLGFLSYDAGDGGNGAPGPDITQIVLGSQGPITSVSDHLAGITVASYGGNGGTGGDFYGAGSAGKGGKGGKGGAVSLQSFADITTNGFESYGILAQSQSGKGGDGGDGYIFASGSKGGSAGQAGTVDVFNYGNIHTFGDGAIGILAQSLGGSAGGGGGSYGLVAQGGGGTMGGNGGAVSVTLSGASGVEMWIRTAGKGAHGVLAQSVGGDGGNAGASIGLLGEGTKAGFGGDGGTVVITGKNGSHIVTEGDGSIGLFAQSIGGGGGNGSFSAGIIALGGAGGGGGDGGRVTVTLDSSSSVSTAGLASYGIFAQSVGGGGGYGAIAGGALALGGSGTSGGAGGIVTVENDGLITTTGNLARGIFAQSVGGGGGAGGFSIGVVSLGGKGGTASTGGAVSVTNLGKVETFGTFANGIQLQSIGGGGGDAGSSGGWLAIGGSGGDGGDAGVVHFTGGGTVVTHGSDSIGLLAQAIGGGGGNGGAAYSRGTFAGVSIGGSGGEGGKGGNVQVDLSSTVVVSGVSQRQDTVIATSGDRSAGLFAQSVGGGGGNGGLSVQATVGAFASVSLAIGGSGGKGGDGGRVDVGGYATITTTGANAAGLFAQSVGGGGGNGGGAVALSASAGLFGDVSISAAIGGSGAGGGAGGIVDLNSGGSILTTGAFSNGLQAQSVGGGGGSGGYAISFAAAVSDEVAVSVGFGLGGHGGKGGAGGQVTGVFDGWIRTEGAHSTAALIQSVGGGGGSGGFDITASVAGAGEVSGAIAGGLGGTGGNGGAGGVVTGTVTGDIETLGYMSDALIVQSVGGGGGAGGFNITGSVAIAGTVGVGLAVGLGGAGGDGGKGDAVTGTAGGTVVTHGGYSNGVTIQSVGGGGGSGAFNVAGSIGAAGTGGVALSVGLGGAGGGGGAGGSVVAVAHSIATYGDWSTAFTAQSIGGGGGNGGFNISGAIGGGADVGVAATVGIGGFGGGGGDASSVTATLTGDVATKGAYASGIIAQSMGGGGGNGAFNVSAGMSLSSDASVTLGLGVGGFGGLGGDASTVDLTVNGTAATEGHDANAILAQSVGGGGGSGGFNITGSVAIATGSGAGNIGVSVGGFGGLGGDADAVTFAMNSGATITPSTVVVSTLGDNSRGVEIQSIGGGGGNGGFAINGGLAIASTAAGNIGIGVGGAGGGGGDGGIVSATLNGAVVTHGAGSDAILVQSLGGGGGNGGFNISAGVAASSDMAGNMMVGVGGFGGDGGDGAAVTSTVTGNIVTYGSNASALTVQSLGGGGGNGAFNISAGLSVVADGTGAGTIGMGVGGFGGGGGSSSNVLATYTGDIGTQGAGSHGVLLQSAAGGGGSGGFNVTAGLSFSTGMTGVLGIGIGGFGGGGGNAGSVTGTLTGNVTTLGNNAFGAVLQSLGGAGGAGGINVTGSMALTGQDNAAVAIGLGLGGFGGKGGDAAAVVGTVTGQYHTSGASADGVLAQSVGGGGGSGGINVTGSIAASAGENGTFGLGVGGFGGDGGDAGSVDLIRAGDTYTDGLDSDGVAAMSLGGGGGRGGINVTGNINFTSSNTTVGLALGLGGFGGGGGAADYVKLSVTGSVLAKGAAARTLSKDEQGRTVMSMADGSNGIVAQSIGGGGGNGGINVSGQLSITKPNNGTAVAASIGIGGFGGLGGNAGDVTLSVVPAGTTALSVIATGDEKSAVTAQSIGGGGGIGGIDISGGLSTGGTIVAGIGGFGGGGGTGADVLATVKANLWASGKGANGLLAQSIGGGGGAGGINISGSITAATKTEMPSIALGLGGFGGAGNKAGSVSVEQVGQIIVEGQESYGILAQSIGGGGGKGGFDVAAAVTASKDDEGFAASLGIGGKGGTGADAGTVDLISAGNVFVNAVLTTSGSTTTWSEVQYLDSDSGGVVAQSIGGGGGVGGINLTGAIAPFGNPVAIGVGGTGGSGGDGGAVSVLRGYQKSGGTTVAAPGKIVVYGKNSPGLLAQSIGGGGGTAGMDLAVAATFAPSGDNTVAAQIVVGGDGGNAGKGGTVTVDQLGDIETVGDASAGLMATSLGGGGGNANYTVGFGLTRKANTLDLAVGGGAGNAGSADWVNVTNKGTIKTNGVGSFGLIAQSLGGGGGNTALSMSMSLAAKNALSVTIGRHGGTGGTAGDVTVDQDGIIETLGGQSSALVAQSIGGGGGTSSATTVALTAQTGEGEDTDSAQSAVSIGLEGGIGATSGDVVVHAKGAIGTSGDLSRGILAQSIGGGGGVGGVASNTMFNNATAATLAIGGTGGSGALAGDVLVDSSATIITTGAQSDGILAQSIGGGGGSGGSTRTINITANIYLSKQNSAGNTLAVNVGGKGGTGGDAGAVVVNNSGTIATAGESSYGLRAQSIGGGGGTGGAVLNMRLQGLDTHDSNSASINIGGEGGTGGTGSTVNVGNTGFIYTTGNNAAGLVAQSVGGGGGDAGLIFDISGGIPTAKASTHSFLVDIGGTGGVGGTSGDVTVVNNPLAGATNSGLIITTGANAYGILAQSIGGGGGNGSSIIQATAYYSGETSGTAGIAIGGKGGSGNTAGAVTVTNGGIIQTSGVGAHGIVAQSIGGGGGNGGMSIAANMTINATSATPLVSVGGAGGDGANSGAVTVTNTGSIFTTGERANGILAQSIGGGGGNANMGFALTGEVKSLVLSNAVSAMIGALSGGTGGIGGTVTVHQSGNITVMGDSSQAIVAQSINGGGGTLSLDFDGITGLPGVPYVGASGTTVTPMPAITANVGGNGTSGMNASKVTVDATGVFVSGGGDGAGGLLQSIGGGGGTLNFKLNLIGLFDDLSITVSPVGIPITVALGGTNGSNNVGGELAGTYTGTITTSGINSPGQLVQSIGGGGGRAIIDLAAPQGTLGPVAVSLGGIGGTDEVGGLVTFTQSGAITTSGALSHGALLQSIGGGGGTASINLTGTGAASVTLTEALGARSGTGLDGGNVSATFSGGVSTSGAHALGLLAQSIGAGGGEMRTTDTSSFAVTLGGTGGASGNGGDIVLTNTGAVRTSGVGAHGVFLQSIGGGGGAVFGNATSVALKSDNTGNGGAIRLTQSGDIVVTGVGADGIVVQSLGGGGGWVDGLFAGSAGGTGSGGTIDVRTTGSVVAVAANASAILAQSQGSAGGGDITVRIQNPGGGKALVLGGLGTTDAEAAAGVKLVGGANNLVDNQGVIAGVPVFAGTVSAVSSDLGTLTVAGSGGTSTVSGINGYAIVASGGTGTAVNNYGLVIGLVDLGSSSHSAFANLANAVFDSGIKVVIGSGNALTNAGLLSPGAYERVMTTAVTGNLVQTPSGVYGLDLDLRSDTSDRLDVSGTASVSGVVHANLVDPLTAPGYATPGTHTKVIVSAAGGATHSGLALEAFNTAAANYTLTYPDTTKIDLQYVVDYSPSGLTGNQHATGDIVNTIQTAQTAAAFRPIAVNLFYLPDIKTLGGAYDLLSGEGVAALEQASFDSGEQFLRAAAAQVGEWFDTPRGAGNSWHLWMTPYGNTAIRGGDAGMGAAKVDQSAYGIAGGVDYQMNDKTLIGIGMGGGSTWVDIPNRKTKATTDAIHIGAYGGTSGEDWYFSGAVSYDIYKNEELRIAAIPGVTLPKSQFVSGPYTLSGYYETPGAKFDSASVSGKFEAGYHFDLGLVRATPFAGLDFGLLSSDGFVEQNAGQTSQIGLKFNQHDTTSMPSLIGSTFDASVNLGGDMLLTGWVKGAWKHEFSLNRTTDAEFIAAPGFNFAVHGAGPARDAAVIDTGLRFTVSSNVSIFTNYTGTFGGPNSSHAGTAGVSIRW